MPSPKQDERQKLLEELERLRQEQPEQYAQRAARLLDELKKKDQRPRYAVT